VTDPLIRLEQSQLTVEPGGQVAVQVEVHNPGTIVESYQLDVVGEQPIDWADVIPPALSVYPQQQETATIIFRPPSGPGTPGGLVPFGIRARSEVDATASAVAEGELTIGQVSGLQAKLTPATSSGRWRGRHTIQISNWGNAPAMLRLVATDPDQALGFLVRPDVVEIPLGGSVTARLKARIRKPVLRGAPTRLAFQVIGEPDPPVPVAGPTSPVSDPGRPVVDGAVTQKPILSRLTVSVAALAVLATVAALVFAFTRPADESQAAGGDGVTVPAKPKLAVASTGPSSATLVWEPLVNIDSYTLYGLDPVVRTQVMSSQPDIDAQQTALKVGELKPSTPYCFALAAVNGDKIGPRSEPACTTTSKAVPPNTTPSETPNAPPSDGGGTSQTPTSDGSPTVTQSTTPTGTPTQTPGGADAPVFTPGQWIGIVDAVPSDSALAETTAKRTARQLTESGTPAKALRSTGQYPGLQQVNGNPMTGWVVYIGPFPSQQEAQARCDTVQLLDGRQNCVLIAQPAV
jgi:SPOR domain